MARIKSKKDETLDRIRIIISDLNGEDRRATIQRYLIILYLASMHPSFRDAGELDKDNLRYFSGPKLKDVAHGMAKEWGKWIKFDRSRTASNKYEMCENDHYVKIKIKSGNYKLFALTKKGFRHCKEIVNSSYRTALSKNLSKVRVIAVNRYFYLPIGIFKRNLTIRDIVNDTPTLYAPYKVEFFRPFKLS